MRPLVSAHMDFTTSSTRSYAPHRRSHTHTPPNFLALSVWAVDSRVAKRCENTLAEYKHTHTHTHTHTHPHRIPSRNINTHTRTHTHTHTHCPLPLRMRRSYFVPLAPATTARAETLWAQLTAGAAGAPQTLNVLVCFSSPVALVALLALWVPCASEALASLADGVCAGPIAAHTTGGGGRGRVQLCRSVCGGASLLGAWFSDGWGFVPAVYAPLGRGAFTLCDLSALYPSLTLSGMSYQVVALPLCLSRLAHGDNRGPT